jgi:acetylglutamate kinase
MLKSPDGMEVPVKGTFEGSALALNVNADAAAGTVKGTLEDGKLKGSYDIGGNAGSWSATRKP